MKAECNWWKVEVAVIPGGLTRFTATKQVLEKAVQRQCPIKVLGVDDQLPIRVYSRWKEEGAIEKSCTSMGA